MARRSVFSAVFALVLVVTVTAGWTQAPAQLRQPEQPALAPGMMMPMMPMIGNTAQMVQFCALMMNQMAGMMAPSQPPQPRQQ